MKKKYQVFVSSTFADLREDRQVAVEAILSAGHIPAGMELFSAGNESQLNVIKRWIDESDIYLLILGGRYGSIEPSSGKSYTQLEYEYAIERNKPLFAVVISEDLLNRRVKQFGQDVLELENREKLVKFKELVLSKICRFYNDPKDIKIAIFETLTDFHHRIDMNGWISGKMMEPLENYLEELANKEEEIRKLKSEIEKRNFLPDLDSGRSLFFKESDVQTRVSRIVKLKHFEELEVDADDEDVIGWSEIDANEKQEFSMKYVSEDFVPHFMHQDKGMDGFDDIVFLYVDGGKKSSNLNDILYQARIQIEEIPDETTINITFIIVSERLTEDIEAKLQEAFNNILRLCKPKTDVNLEIWNKEILNNLEKELGLIFIEDSI